MNKVINHSVIAMALSCNIASAATQQELLINELENLKKSYETRISDLEQKISKTGTGSEGQLSGNRKIYGNIFNPSIGVVLNGEYSAFSASESEITGFAIGEEGERGDEGFSLGESELNFSANVDDKFYGSLTASIVREDGEDKIELEEAFVKTTPGFGLPTGLEVKAGRSLWKIGYLNDHHAHSDDFADRPLPYRAYLNKAFNDDGAEISYVLPTDFYFEIGGGSFRGDDFPFGGGDGSGQFSSYFRVGNNIGENQSWRFGSYILSGEAKEGRVTNEDTVTFIGDTDLYVMDFRYTLAPTGNSRNKELTLQAEYFYRDEDGTYEDTNVSSGAVAYDDHTSGWYVQSVYKFKPEWRVGVRYSQLDASSVPSGLEGSALDSEGHDPVSYSAMVDWSNSEFSQIRLQYNYEELSQNADDNQIILQYVMSFGAHAAHNY